VTGSLRFIQPCSPVTAKTVPSGHDWLHEPKLDGYRVQVVKDGPQVRLFSHRGYNWSKRLAVLAEALRAIPSSSAVLDAELCLPGPDSSPDFFGLLGAMGGSHSHELVVYTFDLLHQDGTDLTLLPLIERKQMLDALITADEIPCLVTVPWFEDGDRLLQAVEKHKLEGVVSKRRSAPYRSGECRDWVKVKTATWREANRERWRLFERKKAGAR
jgi:bifunctional non-homologous end joining protein LigD